MDRWELRNIASRIAEDIRQSCKRGTRGQSDEDVIFESLLREFTFPEMEKGKGK